MDTYKTKYVKSTSNGRLYIETSDFFKQEKIKETIESLLNSEIVKKIDERKKQSGIKVQNA